MIDEAKLNHIEENLREVGYGPEGDDILWMIAALRFAWAENKRLRDLVEAIKIERDNPKESKDGDS